jgi:hypothetical protein
MEDDMTKIQKIYRELRSTLCREDARYAAVRLVRMSPAEINALR